MYETPQDTSYKGTNVMYETPQDTTKSIIMDLNQYFSSQWARSPSYQLSCKRRHEATGTLMG